MPRHEEATDSAQPIAEDERPRGLAAIRFTAPKEVGLGVSFIPDESDLNGSTMYGHCRMTQLVAELFRRTDFLIKHNDQIANFVQPMITRDEYEALVLENDALRQRLDAVELQSGRMVA